MPPEQVNLTTLLSELAASRVDFVLVGGLAAVAQGAPLTTHDVDIVPLRSEENITSLIEFLRKHDAVYRGRADRLEPKHKDLLGDGHHLLSTELGPLDVLGTIEEGRAYQDLLPHAIELRLDGHLLRVLSLEFLIELKKKSSHPKDKNTLLILEAVRDREESP